MADRNKTAIYKYKLGKIKLEIESIRQDLEQQRYEEEADEKRKTSTGAVASN